MPNKSIYEKMAEFTRAENLYRIVRTIDLRRRKLYRRELVCRRELGVGIQA